MIKNIFTTCILLIAFQLNVLSQSQSDVSVRDSTLTTKDAVTSYKKVDSFKDHLRYGGSFNVGFGNNYTTIGISPSVLYDFYNGFYAGVGASYYHTKNNDFDYTSNVYGGSVIALYNFMKVIQLSAEFESLKVNENLGRRENSYWTNGLYAGIAYRARNVSIGIRYDLLFDDQKSFYGDAISPVIRIYF
jgi:hypothetical protein